MEFVWGVLFGVAVTAALFGVVHALGPSGRAGRRRSEPEAQGMGSALHAAAAMLPHLRCGLTADSAHGAVPCLRTLTGAAAIAIADLRTVLAIDGEGRDQVRPGDLLVRLLDRAGEDAVHVEPRLISSDPACPLRSAAIAPLLVAGTRAGALIAFYRHRGGPGAQELKVIEEAASLVSAQVELSAVADHERQLAQAELRALRAQISPHFTFNALAAIAGQIARRPGEARELLINFAEFTRYLFADRRSHVSLSDELIHVEHYLRLEQARFGERLQVRMQIDTDALPAVVPALSLQPLVENAIRHGVDTGGGCGTVQIEGRTGARRVVLTVRDDGPGIEPERASAALRGDLSAGIGLANVDRRLRASFGEEFGLRLEPGHDGGTVATMIVPRP